jgi:hypothetical protein
MHRARRAVDSMNGKSALLLAMSPWCGLALRAAFC